MSGIFVLLLRHLLRFVIAFVMVAVVLSCGYILAATFDLFPQASYRFVIFFLVAVVASNILAKLALSHITT